jgi:hypothetical protein
VAQWLLYQNERLLVNTETTLYISQKQHVDRIDCQVAEAETFKSN